MSQLSIIARARALGVSKGPPAIGQLTRLPAAARGQLLNSFKAALTKRLTADFQLSRLSADAEIQGKLPILRSRSRDQEQNEVLAESFYRLRENNVVGHDGFTLQMKVKLSESIDPETGEVKIVFDVAGGRAIERGWNRFTQRRNFLVTRDMHATEALKLFERTLKRDGELLVRKVKGAPNEFGFGLQPLEADYLDDQFVEFRGVECNCPNERTLPNGQPFPRCASGRHEVRMGVELHGDWKFPVAQWLLANHPGDYFYGNSYTHRRIRIPIEEIIHVFGRKRIEQTRGIPAGVAAMLRLQHHGGMDQAALVTARAAMEKMGVITKTVPEELAADWDPDTAREGMPGYGDRVFTSAPGELLELPMGFDVKPLDFKTPDNFYAPFQKVQARGIASGYGVAYHSLTGDLESVNFSSARLGEVEQREEFRGGQQHLVHDLLLEVYPDFLEAGMLSGIIDLPFSRWDAYVDDEAVCFHGRGFELYDPLNDAMALEKEIELGVKTRGEHCAGVNRDVEQVTAELGREKKLREAAGLESEKVQIAKITAAAAAERSSQSSSSGDTTKSLKSAFLGDVPLGELPEAQQLLIGDFMPGYGPDARVCRYQMTVPELLDKVDQKNLATAQRRVKLRTNKDCAAEVLERKDKAILLLNDRIVDGHHHLAKAEKGKITSSLPVLDLTPLRYQDGGATQKKRPELKSNPNHDPATGEFSSGSGAGAALAHLVPIEPKEPQPPPELLARAEQHDESDPDTWGVHATPAVKEQWPLYEETEGQPVGADPAAWPDGPEADRALSLQEVLDDPDNNIESWPVDQAARDQAQELDQETPLYLSLRAKAQRLATVGVNRERRALNARIADARNTVEPARAAAAAEFAPAQPFLHEEAQIDARAELLALRDGPHGAAPLSEDNYDHVVHASRQFLYSDAERQKPGSWKVAMQRAEESRQRILARDRELNPHDYSAGKAVPDLDGHWVTIDGNHVLIDGPGSFIPKKPSPGDHSTAELPAREEKPAEPARRTFRFRLPEAPGGTPDLIDHLRDNYGKIASPASLRRAGKTLGGEYDGAASLPGGIWAHALFTTRGTGGRPDEAAQALHDMGLLPDAHPDTLWEHLNSAIHTRRTVSRQAATQTAREAQVGRFDKEARDPATAREETEVRASELNVGDKVKVGKEELEVVQIDPDDLTVTLKDHKRYGLQKVEQGEAIYAEVTHPKGQNAPDDSPF